MALPGRTKRLKRVFRKRRQQVGDITVEANRHLDRHLFKRINKIQHSWRFISAWIAFTLLIGLGLAYQIRSVDKFYLFDKPVAGGEFVEGIQGSFSNANPIYAVSSVDTSVSRLIFSGLVKYDNQGKIVGDLAEKWTIDEKATTYTFIIRNNAFWHDGKEVVADDVVYTIQAIQNPDTLSPYNLNWQGVTVKALDKKTVQIVIPGPLTSFIYSLTQGVVPKHVLESTPFAQLRSSEFNNRDPIGSGPFSWVGFSVLSNSDDALRQRIILQNYSGYHLGEPKLDRYTIEVFGDDSGAIDALKSRRINGATLTTSPENLPDSVIQNNIPTLNAVYVFFHTQKVPFNDKKVRNASAQIMDTKRILAQLSYTPTGVNGPLLRNSSAYDKTRVQKTTDIAKAIELLDQAGWVKPPASFVRQKDSKPLEFTLLTEDKPEYVKLVDVLQRQFADVGIKMNVSIKSGKEFQRSLLNHEYEALLYGISIGSDPDVYAYWHSSQATPDRFNFSEYKSSVADSALEGGRSRPDGELRNTKYVPFLDAWRDDSPAVGLYQPRLLFTLNDKLYNFEPFALAQTSDRYANVHNWMIKTSKSPISE